MTEAYFMIYEKINDYMGLGAIMIFFMAALGLFVYVSPERPMFKKYLAYASLWLIGVLNPVTVLVLQKLNFIKDFERFMWLLVPPVVISAGSLLLNEKKKSLYYILLVMLLFSGIKMVNDTEYEEPQNSLKISADAVAVSDIIMQDALSLEDGERVTPNMQMDMEECPKAVVTDPLCEEIRMYNANIRLWFVRSGFGNSNRKGWKRVSNLMSRNNTEIPVSVLIRHMRKKGFSYFVLGDWQSLTGKVEKYNIEKIGSSEHYTVYRYNRPKTLTIKHYADVEGYQCMSYTLYTSDGELIVVDGGRAWQSLELVDTIKEYGGVVDAWIITHAHDDHMGVLASVLEAEWDKSEIEIKNIYIGYMDYDAVNAQGLRTEAVQYLWGNLDKRDNVTVLNTGDVIDVCGFKLEVFHTCNETVTASSGNILNDGSMVFKISGRKKSILFLGDIGDNNQEIRAGEGITDDEIGNGSKMGRLIADEIIESFGDRLKSTCVQVAHHGNNLMPDYFYEAVSPKTAIFDAPDWLMENRNKETGESSYYTTPHYKQLFKDMGAKVVTYSKNREIVIY
ncbi:MAG: MBL fold metallo-hydrolase [Lachnospiraceae bacterium]|nr:MBL fold metallo-hydrolase [Lachnospiraceae bacterium]